MDNEDEVLLLETFHKIEGMIGRQSFHPGRSLFVVAPIVCGLNVIRMVVAPGSAHSFRVPVVGHGVVVVRELFVADGANAGSCGSAPSASLPETAIRGILADDAGLPHDECQVVMSFVSGFVPGHSRIRSGELDTVGSGAVS